MKRDAGKPRFQQMIFWVYGFSNLINSHSNTRSIIMCSIIEGGNVLNIKHGVDQLTECKKSKKKVKTPKRFLTGDAERA